MKYKAENFFFLRVLEDYPKPYMSGYIPKGLQSLQQHLYLSKSYVHITQYAQPL